MERVPAVDSPAKYDDRYWLRGESTNNDVAIQFTTDGQGLPLVPGTLGEVYVPFDAYVLGWSLLSQTAATAVVDVRVSDRAAYPPVEADSITGGFSPTLSNATSSDSFDVGQWSRFVPAGSIVRFVLLEATNLYYLTSVLVLARPGVLAQYLPDLETKADLIHNHNDLYYTEAEIDALLASFGGSHNHDDLYYREAEVDFLIANHDHNTLYYTQAQINAALAAKANLAHQHAATDITSGTLDAARIPTLDAAKIGSGTIDEARIPILTAAKIPSLDASKITTGTFPVAQIPNLDAGKITTGTFSTGRIPSLPATQITSGTLHRDRLPTPMPMGEYFGENLSLTLINVADGTFTDSFSSTITGLQPGIVYQVDVLYIIAGYGDLGVTGGGAAFVAAGDQEKARLFEMDQGVDSDVTIRFVRKATADGSGNIFVRGRHRQDYGTYSLRYQQLTATATPTQAY